MADISGITEGGGVSPVNPENKKEKDYHRLPYTRKTKEVKLRVGEVVQATVLEVLSYREAVVQLPIGTMRAFIHGRLKQGDVLFLKVQETEPSLVLKIHSVSSIRNGSLLAVSEILRILDLPESRFFIELLSFMQKHRSRIQHDEALLIENAYSAMEESIRKENPPAMIFKSIIFMLENNLPMDSRIILKILPVLYGSNYILNLLKALEKLIPALPKAIAEKLKKLFEKLKAENTPFSELLKMLLMELTEDISASTLYEILIEIMLLKETADEVQSYAGARAAAKNIIRVIEGQHFVNTLAINNNTALYFFIPFPIEGSYSVSQVIIRSRSVLKPPEKPRLKFTMITNTPEIGEIVTNGDYQKENINLNIMTSSEKITKLFMKHIAKLREGLKNKGQNIQALGVQDVSGKSLSDSIDDNRQYPPNFSVVI